MKPTPLILSLLALAACDQPAGKPAKPVAPAARPTAATAPLKAQAQSTALVATGPAETIAAQQDDTVQTAAWVVRVDPLTRQGQRTVKLFGLAGGNPAMNGLNSHIAFFRSSADGWTVFRIGDFLDYRVLSESPGRVDLEVTESVLQSETGEIGSRTRRMIVRWASFGDEDGPASITVTPAR
ncbi:hypothetical protein ACIQC9_05715 [Brevundimonas sp. NPDC092305]|uniref:hypothetical protein n=1 Tax=Brevundimonas sp. NPDC092305 TaxID=3363957 RepID=UPI003824E4F2